MFHVEHFVLHFCTYKYVWLILFSLACADVWELVELAEERLHGVAGIVRIVFDRGVQTETTGMQIDPLPEVGHILRGFVGNSGDVVLENQHAIPKRNRDSALGRVLSDDVLVQLGNNLARGEFIECDLFFFSGRG